MTAPPDFEAMARGLFSFAGDKRIATITIDPSVYAIAEALSKAYFGGAADEREALIQVFANYIEAWTPAAQELPIIRAKVDVAQAHLDWLKDRARGEVKP